MFKNLYILKLATIRETFLFIYLTQLDFEGSRWPIDIPLFSIPASKLPKILRTVSIASQFFPRSCVSGASKILTLSRLEIFFSCFVALIHIGFLGCFESPFCSCQ